MHVFLALAGLFDRVWLGPILSVPSAGRTIAEFFWRAAGEVPPGTFDIVTLGTPRERSRADLAVVGPSARRVVELWGQRLYGEPLPPAMPPGFAREHDPRGFFSAPPFAWHAAPHTLSGLSPHALWP